MVSSIIDSLGASSWTAFISIAGLVHHRRPHGLGLILDGLVQHFEIGKLVLTVEGACNMDLPMHPDYQAILA